MKFRIASDSFFQPDKAFHIFRDSVLFLICRFLFHRSEPNSYLIVSVFQFIWELKDAVLFWEWFRKPAWMPNLFWSHLNPGGDGFSWKDVLVGQLAVGILILIL